MSDRIAIFNHGRIEQAGTPAQVYATPSTRFVASFVGDSNILEGLATSANSIDVPGLGTLLTATKRLGVGAPASVLLRPEAIRTNLNGAAPGPNSCSMVLQEVVNFGDSLLLIGQTGPHVMRVRCPAADALSLERGQTCQLSWDARRLHVLSQ